MDFNIILSKLINNESMQILCVVIVLDLIFGILRAIKERKLNSCIGIDGMIRKVGMLITIIVLSVIDYLVNIDFIVFIPEGIKQIISLEKVGITEVFNLLFIIFESLSILKNMVLCKMPIPVKLQKFLERVMKEFTEEIKESEEK